MSTNIPISPNNLSAKGVQVAPEEGLSGPKGKDLLPLDQKINQSAISALKDQQDSSRVSSLKSSDRSFSSSEGQKEVKDVAVRALKLESASEMSESAGALSVEEKAKNQFLVSKGPTKLQKNADQIKKMQEERLLAADPSNSTVIKKRIESLIIESKLASAYVTKSQQKGDTFEIKEAIDTMKQVSTRLNFLQNPTNIASKQNFLTQIKEIQKSNQTLVSDLAKACAKEGVLPSPTITDIIQKSALKNEMANAHVELLKEDNSHLLRARDYFLGTASLPPAPNSSGGLSYEKNDLLIKSMADKIRADNVPGGIEKLGGGSGGVYKLSSKNQEGAMEPIFVFKIEDEEPGGAFCRTGFEEGTLDLKFPNDEGLVREEFVNRSPLDSRHAVRHTLPHHDAFNSKSGITMPPREGVVLPFVKGGVVLEDLGISRLETKISGTRVGKNASDEEKIEAQAKIASLNAKIAEQTPIALSYGIDESRPPSEWRLWDDVSQESGQLVLAKACAYGNTDANDGNIMVVGISKPGDRGVLHDFDYGRAVPKGVPDDYGTVTFRGASFAKAQVLPTIKGKINQLNVDQEVSRMRSTWNERNKGNALALDQQEESLRAHLNLLKIAINSEKPEALRSNKSLKETYTLAEVFNFMEEGGISETLEAVSGLEGDAKWSAFNQQVLEKLPKTIK